MATKAEQFRAEEERTSHTTKKEAPRSKPDVESNASGHAGRKATYALEKPVVGRPSRKSSRKSANRAKPDTALNLREEARGSSADARFRRANPGGK